MSEEPPSSGAQSDGTPSAAALTSSDAETKAPPPGLPLEVIVEEEADWSAVLEDVEVRLRAVLEAAWAAVPPESLPPAIKRAAGAEVSLLLTSDARIQALNRDYRGKDRPTNVLSFAALEGEEAPPPIPDEAMMLGDIVLALETVTREAAEQGKTFHDHLCHLAAHGLLHLLGYDHERGADAAQAMERLEVAILATLGIPNPYQEAAADRSERQDRHG